VELIFWSDLMAEVLGNGAGMTIEQIRAQILGDVMPKSEAGVASAGDADKASRDNHTHPTISWRGSATVSAAGLATFDFSAKPYDVEPVPVLSYFESAAAATSAQGKITLNVESWVMGSGATAGKYVGCTVRAARSRPIPQNLVSLLAGAVYDLFGGGSLTGVKVYLVVLPASA
jgi:hypothetical protein